MGKKKKSKKQLILIFILILLGLLFLIFLLNFLIFNIFIPEEKEQKPKQFIFIEDFEDHELERSTHKGKNPLFFITSIENPKAETFCFNNIQPSIGCSFPVNIGRHSDTPDSSQYSHNIFIDVPCLGSFQGKEMMLGYEFEENILIDENLNINIDIKDLTGKGRTRLILINNESKSSCNINIIPKQSCSFNDEVGRDWKNLGFTMTNNQDCSGCFNRTFNRVEFLMTSRSGGVYFNCGDENSINIDNLKIEGIVRII